MKETKLIPLWTISSLIILKKFQRASTWEVAWEMKMWSNFWIPLITQVTIEGLVKDLEILMALMYSRYRAPNLKIFFLTLWHLGAPRVIINKLLSKPLLRWFREYNWVEELKKNYNWVKRKMMEWRFAEDHLMSTVQLVRNPSLFYTKWLSHSKCTKFHIKK